MLFKIMFNLLGNPFNIMSAALTVVALALAVYYAVKLSSEKQSELLPGMEHGINIMLPVSFGILFLALLAPAVTFIQASYSIARSGPGDPRVVLDALIGILMPVMFYGALSLFFLIVWYFLRVLHRRRIEQL